MLTLFIEGRLWDPGPVSLGQVFRVDLSFDMCELTTVLRGKTSHEPRGWDLVGQDSVSVLTGLVGRRLAGVQAHPRPHGLEVAATVGFNRPIAPCRA